MNKQLPVYETYIDSLNDGRIKVLTLEPTKYHVQGLHGTRGYFETNEPVGYISTQLQPPTNPSAEHSKGE